MSQRFAVDHLDVERLLTEWRWLYPGKMALVARTAFGDLFLRNETGVIFWLNTAVGKLTRVSDSESQFHEMAKTDEKRSQWFAEPDEETSAKRGLSPDFSRCIGFPAPLVFGESGTNHEPYLVDLYEHVSFLGDLNRQISSLPDGAKVRLRFGRPPSS